MATLSRFPRELLPSCALFDKNGTKPQRRCNVLAVISSNLELRVCPNHVVSRENCSLMNVRVLARRWSLKRLDFVSIRLGIRPLTLACNEKRPSHDSERQFVVFYRWPNMKLLRVLSRLKMYQVVTMTTLLCPLTYWYNVGNVSSYVVWCAYSSTLGVTAMLCAMSYAFSRLVGELSYCERNETIQLSTLTFFGRRTNSQFPARAIVPFSEGRRGLTKSTFLRLDVTKPQGVYYYSIKYGRILDWELMKKALEIYI